MNLLSILYFLLIRPLELIYELIFSLSYKFTGSAVLSIVFLSITVGLLCLPLYTRADALQAEANAIEKKLKPWKTEIKKNFKGDEQVMMLQAYYRENNYHPLMMMRSSISLLLQIPFFISAYHMLSSSVALQGTSFGPIADLGAPDGIIKIGAFAINLLPILMTAINIISGTIYSKDLDKKAKIQLYVTALVFLVLLYNSPSGLVLYWTLNNVFSLVKNIVMKLIPIKASSNSPTHSNDNSYTIIFILNALCLSIFVGLLIPSDLLVDSVGNFLTNYRTINIPHYLFISLLISLGLFFVWGSIYHFILANRRATTYVFTILNISVIIDYYLFYTKNGTLDRSLFLLYYSSSNNMDILLNAITIVLISLLLYLFFNKTKPIILITIPIFLSIIVLSALNTYSIIRVNDSYSYIEDQRQYPELTLSRTGQNVVVIMLDRAVGRVTPYIFNERPDLIEQFDGFTWYSNSLSFGQHTNMGAPALYGGYEYTPTQMNARSDISLQDKHNEALLVMPVVFANNGYDVTVIDPPYAGYMEIPDLSIYDDYPDISAYISNGILNPYFDSLTDTWSETFERNLFAFSLRMASPVIFRDLLYDDGYYNDLNRRITHNTTFQNSSDISHATGYSYDFMNAYYSLTNLESITNITDENDIGSYVQITNGTTHDSTILEEPSYTVSNEIDNSEYDSNNSDRFFIDGRELELYYPEEMGFYHSQAAAFEELGNWFDYLREQGVYDNTRIIIVSDHGLYLYIFGYTEDPEGNPINIANLNCLFMVKDFGESGFSISNELITNAETPILAFNGIIDNPTNPFTERPIVTQLDHPNDFLYFDSGIHSITQNNGNTFLPGDWYRYDPSYGDIYNEAAWEYVGYY